MKLLLNEWCKYLHKSSYTVIMPIILLIILIFYYGGIYFTSDKTDLAISPAESKRLFFFGMTICYYYTNFIAITMASTILSKEISRGTITFVLTRPYQRYKILLAKIGAIILFTPVFLIFGTIIILLLQLITVSHLPEFSAILKTSGLYIVLTLVVTIFYSSIALLFSTLSSSSAFITSFCYSFYFFATPLWQIINSRYLELSPNSWIFKLSPLKANDYLIDLVKNTYYQSVEPDLYIVLLANLGYTCIFFLLAVLIFRRQDISLLAS